MKPTVPRPKPSFRELLQQKPGWWVPRIDYEPRHSSEILADGKGWQVWKRASLHESGLGEVVIFVSNGEQWFFGGNGDDPVNPWTGEPYAPIDEKAIREDAEKAALARLGLVRA